MSRTREALPSQRSLFSACARTVLCLLICGFLAQNLFAPVLIPLPAGSTATNTGLLLPKDVSKSSFSELHTKESSSTSSSSILNDLCVYTAWRGRIPPQITSTDSPSTRRRFDSLPRITVTQPLPFTNVVLRSSFKAGSTFMTHLVKSLYEGNTTRQLWLNETRRQFQQNLSAAPRVAAVFLRDPIDRFGSIYTQMHQFSNRKYHWYGDGDADWFNVTVGTVDRFKAFVASVKRRFYNDHLLPQLWFLSENPDRPPSLGFVGRIDQMSEHWVAMTAALDIPVEIARDGKAFIDKPRDKKDLARNFNKYDSAKLSFQRALYKELDGNKTLLDICNIYRADFECFSHWLRAPHVCTKAWSHDMP